MQNQTATDADDPATTLPSPTTSRMVTRICDNLVAEELDVVIEEVPVALVYNGISYAVMLASPLDLTDFALGFSLSERIIDSAAELYAVEVKSAGEAGIVLDIDIASARFAALKMRRRQLAGRTGCGLCGIESLQQFSTQLTQSPTFPTLTRQRPANAQLSMAAITAALADLPRWQTLHQQCGAAHAAAWADQQGKIHLVREDVGRHNALDKLLGALATNTHSPAVSVANGFALLTSRASYELVQKAVTAGLSALVAVSAPTALAVRMAEVAGLLLIGFTRQQGMVVYAGKELLGG